MDEVHAEIYDEFCMLALLKSYRACKKPSIILNWTKGCAFDKPFWESVGERLNEISKGGVS